MAVLAAFLAACVDHRDSLAPGERGVIPLLAAGVQQAASAFAFVEGVFAVAPNLKDLVDGATSDTLSLTTGIDIQVRPASYRTIRGITAIAAIADASVREGGEHGERRWGRWQSARTGAGEEFVGTFSAAVGVRELPMAKGQKRSAKEAKKPKANKPKTSVSDYKKSVIASGHK
jgi:hypothetical protein